MLSCKIDLSKYPNDAIPFFYGEEEPYEYLYDIVASPGFNFNVRIRNVNPTTLALDIVNVQAMSAPNLNLYYLEPIKKESFIKKLLNKFKKILHEFKRIL